MGFEEDEGTISGTDSQYLDKPLPVYRTYIGRISFYFETFWVVSRCFKHRVYNQKRGEQDKMCGKTQSVSVLVRNVMLLLVI